MPCRLRDQVLRRRGRHLLDKGHRDLHASAVRGNWADSRRAARMIRQVQTATRFRVRRRVVFVLLFRNGPDWHLDIFVARAIQSCWQFAHVDGVRRILPRSGCTTPDCRQSIGDRSGYACCSGLGGSGGLGAGRRGLVVSHFLSVPKWGLSDVGAAKAGVQLVDPPRRIARRDASVDQRSWKALEKISITGFARYAIKERSPVTISASRLMPGWRGYSCGFLPR